MKRGVLEVEPPEFRMLEALHTVLATSDVLPGPYGCKVRALLEELVRSERRVAPPGWTVEPVNLESLVLAYMGRARTEGRDQRLAQVGTP